jgi:hypothetical protein
MNKEHRASRIVMGIMLVLMLALTGNGALERRRELETAAEAA